MNKVSIVLGHKKTKYLQWYFDNVSEGLELQFCELSDDSARINSSFQVSYFQPVIELKGYMRGLEVALKGSDIVVGFLSESVSAFQALGIAEKNKMKFVLVADCGASSYSTYDHFSVVQQLFSRSDLFLSYDENYKELIELEGVSSEKIVELPVKFHLGNHRSKYCLGNYFAEDKTHIVCGEDLSNYNSICTLLNQLKKIEENATNKDFLLSLIGDGSEDEMRRLSYFIFDVGLKDKVRLFQANNFDFKTGIVSMADIFVNLSSSSDIFSENHALLMQAYSQGIQIYSTEISNAYSIMGLASVDSMEVVVSSPVAVTSIDTDNDKSFLYESFKKLETKIDNANIVDLYQSLYENSDFLLAVSNYQSVVSKLDGEVRSRVLFYVASSYYKLSKFEKAEELLRDSLSFYNLLEANNLLARFLFISQSFNDSLGFYKASLAIDKDNIEAIFGIACVYERTGLYEDSLFWLEKCIYKSSSIDKYLTLYSRICLEVDDYIFAIMKLDHIISIVGEFDSLLFSLGKLYLKCGDSERGQYYIERSKIIEINKAG